MVNLLPLHGHSFVHFCTLRVHLIYEEGDIYAYVSDYLLDVALRFVDLTHIIEMEAFLCIFRTMITIYTEGLGMPIMERGEDWGRYPK